VFLSPTKRKPEHKNMFQEELYTSSDMEFSNERAFDKWDK
jgi:hypothetical protein